MANVEIDIREYNEENLITKIRYGDEPRDYIEQSDDMEDVLFSDVLFSDEVSIKDIGNLIKALEHAKKIWS